MYAYTLTSKNNNKFSSLYEGQAVCGFIKGKEYFIFYSILYITHTTVEFLLKNTNKQIPMRSFHHFKRSKIMLYGS